MITGIKATICEGYTGWDHLIDDDDRTSATAAVAGIKFRRAADALRAADRAYMDSCDRRCSGAIVQVTLRTARGDVVTVR